MGCGCGKAKVARQVTSFTKAPRKERVLMEIANHLAKPKGNKVVDEKRKVEKKRREEILKALARPQ